MKWQMIAAGLCVCLLAGCSGSGGTGQQGGDSSAPSFTLAWSEYPSWSVFGVASEEGLINGKQGELGPVEEKWGVDIVLEQADYDTCLTLFGNGTVDAVCMTNMDSLAPSLGRSAVAVLPTSTSVGADACIVVGIENLDGLKGKPTYGLAKSVSEYAFERSLIQQGQDPKDFPFKNMDPAAAAQAMQTGQKGIESIMVWNPFVLQTLRDAKGAKRLFDSSTIPEEIIDMVVVGKDVLGKPKGEEFVCAVIDAYYRFNRLLEEPDKQDEMLVALGAKFSSLGLEDMKQVVQETRFYKTPDEALGLFEGEKFRDETTPRVSDFCVSHGIVDDKPAVGFGDAAADLNFDAAYIKKVQEKK